MSIYRVFNICWDTDGETFAKGFPPSEMMVDVPAGYNVEDFIADALSDCTGWCHFGYEYKLAS